MTGQGDMIYVPPARFVSGSRVFVTPYMEGVRSVPTPLKGTEFEGEGTVPQFPTCGIPVQGLSDIPMGKKIQTRESSTRQLTGTHKYFIHF